MARFLIYTAREMANMIQYVPAELRSHLKSLLLCGGSIMGSAVEALIRCYRFKQPLEVGGKGRLGYQPFVSIARRLNIDVGEVELPRTVEQCVLWANDRSTEFQKAWIPANSEREADLHAMLPFFIRYHLRELRKHDPAFPEPKVDNLYLMLIAAECFGLRNQSISVRVLNDLLAYETLGVLSAYRTSDSIQDEIRTVHHKVTSLSNWAQMYLGFVSGAEGRSIAQEGNLVGHPFNERTRKMAAAMGVVVRGNSRPSPLPHLVRRYIWSNDQVSVIARNAWNLNLFGQKFVQGDEERVRHCLTSRLRGKSEGEILVEMAFESVSQYHDWQVSHAIDLDSGGQPDAFSIWLKACEYFELEPNVDTVENYVYEPIKPDYSGQAGGHVANISSALGGGKEQDLEKDVAEFRHSPDFRSVVALSGESFALSPKQAQVIKMLYDSWDNRTPEISQAAIITEVYPSSSDRQLRRLFRCDEAYDALIGQGSRKGLVRLII